MPRQNRRRPQEPTPTDAAAMGRGAVRRDSGPDGDWYVRPVTGAAATKTYRCPGCDQEIRPATPHLVVWPDDGSAVVGNDVGGSGLRDRRHWHSACWSARGRRGPRVQRGRAAPRF
ncbi:MAG: hypothetical protein ACXV4A_13505 [Actinomycetes bacterium]